ncbi:PcfJ domain-containing protein [Phocaeicola plebeius]|uniref:PcfJ domain-containing protein n=1 Tax=Phocaeicola plebeius TaxID=310297 RepID=UPI00266D18CA|nr:PcfJ domain-containing protein [Phocaeicola plebeius]
MKPHTNIQKEIVQLAQKLPKLTERQKAYAYEHCFKHYAHRTKGGMITCMECGHRWKSEHRLAEKLCGCTCPHCGRKLEVMDTRQRVFTNNEYFSIVTTCNGYQVFRFFYVKVFKKVMQPAKYSITEVVQRWISSKGETETFARLRCMFGLYYDMWSLNSNMELRSQKRLHAYNIYGVCTYPQIKLLPKLKYIGFRSDFYGSSPYDYYAAVLSDCRIETLPKAGQTCMFRHAITNGTRLKDYWAAIKICIRNRYEIKEPQIWCDYIKLLKHFKKDIHNAKYVCPANLHAEHDRLVQKRNVELREEQMKKDLQKALTDEKKYKEQKGRFFGLSFSDGTLKVKVLESVTEFFEEGMAMHHCVFSNQYYLKEDSLILSASIEGKRIETIELSLDTMQIVQSRGACNMNTSYHRQIIELVNKNIQLIEQRLTA